MLKPYDNFNMVRGMSQMTPAHVLEQEPRWWYTKNARFRHGRITQTLPLRDIITLPGGDITSVTNLSGFNTRQNAVSGKGLYRLDFSTLSATFVPQPGGFVIDSTEASRWYVVQTQGGVFYSNLLNRILKYDGTASTFNYSGSGPDYKAKYLANFYGHLVAAHVYDGSTYLPLRVAYSDLNQFDIFEPLATNEADFYDLLENPLNAIYGAGITGIQKVGDLLAIFTPGSIWNMRYVGFDNGVMQFTEQIQGLGNWFPHATVAIDRYCLFISNEDFYVYDGTTATPIGGPIRELFFSRCATEPSLRAKVWAYIETLNQEVRWYFPSQTSVCDCCVVFNWQTKDWYFEEGKGLTAALNAGGSTSRTVDQLDNLSFTINGLDAVASSIDTLDAVAVVPQSLYTTSNSGTIGIETDYATSFPITEFESRDYILGDIQTIKELDTIYIDAEVSPNDYISGQSTAPDSTVNFAIPLDKAGWQVYVAVRSNIRDAVNFTYVGLWDGSEPELRLTSARLSGRIFRFRFVSSNTNNSKFFGFSPNFNERATEK